MTFVRKKIIFTICIAASLKVPCRFSSTICEVIEPIEHEASVLESSRNTTVTRFDISLNRDAKHLPRHIGALFPELQGLLARRCGLTTVRNHYFRDMQNLRFLYLYSNKIATIEPNAFLDLTSVKELWLQYNLIETLDEQIFVPMVSLEKVSLSFNKIKFLYPATFNIPGVKLDAVFLIKNVCIDGIYRSNNLPQLRYELSTRCFP